MDLQLYPLVERWNPRLGRNEWVETEPDACPKCGAPWDRPFTMQRASRECSVHRGGHRKWRCVTCNEVTVNLADDADCS